MLKRLSAVAAIAVLAQASAWGQATVSVPSGSTFVIGGSAVPSFDPSVPTNPATGLLSVSGLANALAYAGGITIGDGAAHTISNAPVGSIFYGKTTLASLAAITINGTQPWAFLTDTSGTTGNLCTYGGTANCFTSTTGAYKLTDAKVPSLDIAWLAIQAALITRRAYIPAGQYLVGTTLPLPLMIPMNYEGNINAPLLTADYVQGDTNGATQLVAGSSFGQLADGNTNIPLLGCGDPGATPSNNLGRWNGGTAMCRGEVRNLSLFGSTASNVIGSTYYTDGFAHGARLNVWHLESHDFFRDITLTGDHTAFYEMQASGGLHGVYWTAQNSALQGDFTFYDLSASGQKSDSVEVSGSASFAGYFKGETYLNAGLYDINGDNDGCNPVVGATYIDNLMTEYNGLGVINDAHNYSTANATYTDSNKCRAIVNLNVTHWFNSWQNSNIPSGIGSRRRRATIDVSAISGQIMGMDANGGEFNPVADNVGAAGLGVINTNSVGDNQLRGLDVGGMMTSVFTSGQGQGPSASTIPFINEASVTASYPQSQPTWAVPGGGQFGTFYALSAQGNYTTTVGGDVMEEPYGGGYTAATPGGTLATAPVLGIAVQAGLTNGQLVPLQTRGIVYVNQKYFNGGAGTWIRKSVGRVGPPSYTAGSGGTAGTYSVTGTGGGCTTEPVLSVVVGSGGSITGVTVTNGTSVAGCTSAPSFSTSSVTGLSGGALSTLWPSASVDNVTSPALADVVVGAATSYGSGSTNSGTQAYAVSLKPTM